MGKGHLEAAGMLKVMHRDDRLRHAFCKWGSANGGWDPHHCSLEFLPETLSILLGLPPLLLAKVISTLEPTLPCTSPPGRLLGPLRTPPNASVSEHIESEWVLDLSKLGKIRKVAILVFLLSTASLACLRDAVGHRGSWEPAGGLEGELQRLSNSMIRERAWSTQLTALQACSDSAFSNRRKSVTFAVLPLTPPFRMFTLKTCNCFFSNSHKTTKQYLLFFWGYTKTVNENRIWDLCLPTESPGR